MGKFNPVITLQLFATSEEEYQAFKASMADEAFSETIAIISNEDVQHELFITEGRLTDYIAEKTEQGEFETTDETSVTDILEEAETLEDFVSRIFRLML